MSLATRCPACGTVFRVVSDQLKVSEGWVRCGRCTEVFNAAQRLFELEPGSAAPSPPPQRPVAEVHRLPLRGEAAGAAAAARVGSSLAPASATPAEREPAGAPVQTTAAATPTPFAAASGPAAEQPLAGLDAATANAAAPAAAGPGAAELEALPATAATPPAATRVAGQAEPMTMPAAAATSPAATPEFVRRADRAARWRHPSRRGPLAALALLLLALLAGQIGVHYRDTLAAGWPATKPWLQAACRLLGCRVEAPRRIESLNVDSSGLVRLQDSPLYRLSLVVQNKASTPVRMPAVDLVLTDGQGQTTARRVLRAAELGHVSDSLPAGGEVSLQATLDLGERGVAGYTVELFYP
jgi:predicted Zn finger-like uncharacterized protein